MSTTLPVVNEYRMKEWERRHRASLADLFAETCAMHGERIALTLDGRSITYSELDLTSNRIASALMEQGARPGTIVAICLERSVEMIAAMLGVTKSGAAYLPIDPGYPVARIAETIADAAPIAGIGST